MCGLLIVWIFLFQFRHQCHIIDYLHPDLTEAVHSPLFSVWTLYSVKGELDSGSVETALVIIHLSIFSHALLHYSHRSICTAIRVCHSNELQLASPVIITGAVLPFIKDFSCHAKLPLKTAKVPYKCHSC